MTLVKNDKEFKSLVYKIASGSDIRRESVIDASEYLWNAHNWERLKDSNHGFFLREHSVNNPVPDLYARAGYRRMILSEVKSEE